MSIPLFYNAMVEVNPFSTGSNKLINEILSRYKDFVVVYTDSNVVNSMFTCYDEEDTALFLRLIGFDYEWKGRKGFVDEFGIKHYGANKSAQVLYLLDHFVSFLNPIEKQFTYKDVKVRLILSDLTLELFDSDHAEAKSILKELLMLYFFTIDSTLAYKRLTFKFSDENEFKFPRGEDPKLRGAPWGPMEQPRLSKEDDLILQYD
ncbi:hypothetical protein MBM_07486 [Drepanopeziza brunnea f. sp. 'multigermtubi' MB_m1]|uniref:Uncharacterized protein n=1 Tax=Marssonina brunnea f. sp. multigermtubi (strain MB_m1) TaxID=1072389 RepID=K1WN09_MARBU|nr:uncharacterized protein MBM_07486 [Drepanopeziza brunnea f. sp. 'multigermtubi' MB_m1]EKD14256.1 hypothetical protein MBM_07486 [Drepanopeziza brunnea f. sp. 'multigermtubi' MB_m1]